ncbi:DMT family transporter [uncultured Hyphomicrobium sp.]|uniref:DMT family transporter n=1 Tax=uncultured Hyphomicrobium sp. TaxID=194373 RepID=UPI0025DE6720|nr:DMT family transporter [uncultured Hyphomicrobium sp.]
MSLQAAALSTVAFVVGALLSIQAPINAMAGARLGHPLGGALLSFVVGTLFLAVVTMLLARSEVAWGNVASLSPVLWLGGVLGAIYITAAIVLTPTIGVGALIALTIAGQVTASLVLDHYGVLELATREITMGRAAGAVLVVVGALMVRFF